LHLLLNHHILFLFVLFGFTSHRHSICHMVTFQLHWWRKTSEAIPCIILGTNGYLSRTTNIPLASLIASLHERIQSPCRDSNPQRWGAIGLKTTTLTTQSRHLSHSLVTEEIFWRDILLQRKITTYLLHCYLHIPRSTNDLQVNLLWICCISFPPPFLIHIVERTCRHICRTLHWTHHILLPVFKIQKLDIISSAKNF
jgi:hypothetical protein